MPHWLALRPELPADASPATAASVAPEALALGWWALQFTPRVALLDEAVVLEVEASLNLFGGAQALYQRMTVPFAAGPTSLAALALLRAASTTPSPAPSAMALLDPLPLHTLSAVALHEPTLARLGCRSLGQVRALPRAGLSRRFGAGLLTALDQAYGSLPESHVWLSLPERFDARLELPGRVDAAPALMFAAQRLLNQLGTWLAARHAGVRSIVLGWRHDFGPRSAGEGGELRIRTADVTRRIEHLARLLAEQLARTELAAPVGVVSLHADEVELLAEASAPLWPGWGAGAERVSQGQWTELVERLSARLGADQVLCPQQQADHRPELQVAWVPASQMLGSARQTRHAEPGGRIRHVRHVEPRQAVSADGAQGVPGACGPAGWPQPAWLLPRPIALVMRDERPLYQGPLQILAGPQRVEAGWWTGEQAIARDYYVAYSARAGLLCLYRERLPQPLGASSRGTDGCDGSGWFLQGFYG